MVVVFNPFKMLSIKQGSSIYHFIKVFGMTRPWFKPPTSQTQHSKHYATEFLLFYEWIVVIKSDLFVNQDSNHWKTHPSIRSSHYRYSLSQSFFLIVYRHFAICHNMANWFLHQISRKGLVRVSLKHYMMSIIQQSIYIIIQSIHSFLRSHSELISLVGNVKCHREYLTHSVHYSLYVNYREVNKVM